MSKVLWSGLATLLSVGIFMMLKSGTDPGEDLSAGGASFIEGVRILQKKDGSTAWDLTAGTAVFTTEGDAAQLQDVRVKVPENGVVLYTDEGVYDFTEKTFTTGSSVKAQGRDYRLTADTMEFDISSGNLSASGDIVLDGQAFDIEGKALSVDSDQKVKVSNGVKATFHK
jgi:lipopolysaccharide assembly outer membrane protein LptD (OstA)